MISQWYRIILARGKLATIHYDFAPRSQRSCFAHPNLHIHKVVLLGINIALVCKVSQSVMSKVLNKLRNFQKTQLGRHLYEGYLYNYQTFTHRFKLILNTFGKTLFFVAHKLFWHSNGGTTILISGIRTKKQNVLKT